MTSRPLEGRRVAVARSEEESDDLGAALEALGAEILCVPVIRHAAGGDPAEIARAVHSRASYTWLVFTSRNAVRFFFEAATRLGAGAGEWRATRIAAVGPRTARAVEEAGLRCALVQPAGGGASLARLLLEAGGLRAGGKVLLPRSAIARPELGGALEAAGVAVDAVTVYDTTPGDPAKVEPFLAALRAGRFPDAVMFTSPSALRAFLALTADEGRRALAREAVRIVTIGPTTSQTVRDSGLRPAAEAREPTPEGMAGALLRALLGVERPPG